MHTLWKRIWRAQRKGSKPTLSCGQATKTQSKLIHRHDRTKPIVCKLYLSRKGSFLSCRCRVKDHFLLAGLASTQVRTGDLALTKRALWPTELWRHIRSKIQSILNCGIFCNFHRLNRRLWKQTANFWERRLGWRKRFRALHRCDLRACTPLTLQAFTSVL